MSIGLLTICNSQFINAKTLEPFTVKHFYECGVLKLSTYKACIKSCHSDNQITLVLAVPAFWVFHSPPYPICVNFRGMKISLHRK